MCYFLQLPENALPVSGLYYQIGHKRPGHDPPANDSKWELPNVVRSGGCASALKVGATTNQDAINMVSDSFAALPLQQVHKLLCGVNLFALPLQSIWSQIPIVNRIPYRARIG